MKYLLPLLTPFVILISLIILDLIGYIAISHILFVTISIVIVVLSYCIYKELTKPKTLDPYQEYLDDLAKGND